MAEIHLLSHRILLYLVNLKLDQSFYNVFMGGSELVLYVWVVETIPDTDNLVQGVSTTFFPFL